MPFVVLKKIEKHDNNYLYEIESEEFQSQKHYVEIDPMEKVITFYNDELSITKKANLKLNEPIGVIPNIPEELYMPIFMAILKMIRTDDFLDIISYETC